MKQGKLLILLVLILSLCVFLFACGNDKEPAENGAAEEQEVKHELHDYLVLKEEENGYAFSDVSQYEGKVVDRDREHNLLAIKTQDLDEMNQVTDTVAIYDILTGEKLQEHSATYPLDALPKDKVEFEVEINYPIVRVSKTSQSEIEEDEYEEIYDVQYYFAKKDSEIIRSTASDNFERYDYGNGLVAFDMGDDIVWIDRYMNELRSVKAIAANGYDIEAFDSEYQGYLYTWGYNNVQIFNRQGNCSGSYTMKDDGFLNVHVLDNGNALVQEMVYVDAGESYDYIQNYDNGSIQRIKVNSYVMSYLDGKMTPYELSYVVDSLETAYTERYDDNNGHGYMPFKLAEGRDNQALIYRFSGGKLSLYGEYVVMNNSLKIEYTVKNTTPGVEMVYATPISYNMYSAPVAEGGAYQTYIFDLDGNKVSPLSTDNFYKTKHYIITDNAVYDLKMNLLYDLCNSEFAKNEIMVDYLSERIYLTKHNFVTGGDETYLLNPDTKQTSLLCDGIKESFIYADDGFYVLTDEEKGKANFYDLNGEVMLSILHTEGLYWFNDAFVVIAEFEGKPITYVVK